MAPETTNKQGLINLLIALSISIFLLGLFFHYNSLSKLKMNNENLTSSIQIKENLITELKKELNENRTSLEKSKQAIDSLKENNQLLNLKITHDEKIRLINLYTVANQQHYFDVLTGKITSEANKGRSIR